LASKGTDDDYEYKKENGKNGKNGLVLFKNGEEILIIPEFKV
jgi:hypothetical protein